MDHLPGQLLQRFIPLISGDLCFVPRHKGKWKKGEGQANTSTVTSKSQCCKQDNFPATSEKHLCFLE